MGRKKGGWNQSSCNMLDTQPKFKCLPLNSYHPKMKINFQACFLRGYVKLQVCSAWIILFLMRVLLELGQSTNNTLCSVAMSRLDPFAGCKMRGDHQTFFPSLTFYWVSYRLYAMNAIRSSPNFGTSGNQLELTGTTIIAQFRWSFGRDVFELTRIDLHMSDVRNPGQWWHWYWKELL